MQKVWILLVLVSAACGREAPRVDAALAPILDQYLTWAPDYGRLDDLESLTFGDPGAGRDGVCDIQKRAVGKTVLYKRLNIVISPGEMTPSRTATVMHELAHCLHDKEHNDDTQGFTLMSAETHDDDEYWTENLELRVKEIFQ